MKNFQIFEKKKLKILQHKKKKTNPEERSEFQNKVYKERSYNVKTP